MNRESSRAGIGSAHLSDALDQDAPFTIHGVAIGADDVTLGSSGVKKVWPGEELEKAATSLEGKPLVKDHHNSVDGVIGQVTDARFREGVGVLYEAEIDEQFEETAQKIANGRLDVSARAFHAPTEELEEDDDTGALVVEDVEFDNLSVVTQGAAPSNTVQVGESSAMADGLDKDRGLQPAELRAAFDYDDHDIDDSDRDDLGLHVIRMWGHLPLDEEFVDGEEIDGVISNLESHEAVTVVRGEGEDRLLLVVDSAVVDSNSELNEHVRSTVEGTPFDVHDEWDWIDRAEEEFEAHEGVLDAVDELLSGTNPHNDDGSDEESEELKSVAGVTFTGTATGKLEESEIPNDDFESHYLFDADTKSDSSYPVVDGDGNLRRGNVESAFELGARGGVSESELHSKLEALNDEFENPPIDSEEFSNDEEESSSSGPTTETESITVPVFGESSVSSPSVAQLSTTHHDIMTDYQFSDASEETIEEMEDPVLAEREDVESLREKAERADDLSDRLDSMNETLDELAEAKETLDELDDDHIEELREFDDAVVLGSDEHDELTGLVDEIGQIYAEELAEYSPFDAEELQERWTPLELRDKVNEHDEASLERTIESGEDPDPNGGDATEEELEQGTGEAEREELEEAAREEIATELDEMGWNRQAEKVREGEFSLDDLGVEIEA